MPNDPILVNMNIDVAAMTAALTKAFDGLGQQAMLSAKAFENFGQSLGQIGPATTIAFQRAPTLAEAQARIAVVEQKAEELVPVPGKRRIDLED